MAHSFNAWLSRTESPVRACLLNPVHACVCAGSCIPRLQCAFCPDHHHPIDAPDHIRHVGIDNNTSLVSSVPACPHANTARLPVCVSFLIAAVSIPVSKWTGSACLRGFTPPSIFPDSSGRWSILHHSFRAWMKWQFLLSPRASCGHTRHDQCV